MKCDKVKSYLDEYYDGTLPDDFNENISDHLAECDKCNSEYKLLSNFLQQTSRLQSGVKAPEDILDKIADQLMKIPSKTSLDENESGELRTEKAEKVLKKRMQKRKKGPAKRKKNLKKSKSEFSKKIEKLIPVFIGLAVVIGGYLYYENSLNNSPWEIELISGNYTINGFEVDNKKLNEGDVLSTLGNTRLRINIPEMGFSLLEDSTSVILVEAKKGENVLKIYSGSMQVESEKFPPGFTLQTDFASIVDLGSSFRLRFITFNEIELEVENGEVDIFCGEENLKLIVDHLCRVSENRGISIPYHINSSTEFKQALFVFERDKKNIFSLNTMLSESEDFNAFTLWSLLKIADPSNRGAILYEMQSSFPLPPNVTSEGIISLDDEMLELYWREIEWQLQR